MTNTTQEVLKAPRSVRVQYEPAVTSSHFFLNALLLLVTIPAAVITFIVLVAMVPFRLPEILAR
ncbi:MAG: hypothetical protein DYG98_11590 [Haliscomenobacteraceae bacterium CHB4]|nr:hypothetical protein [Saprospiraceae bacterium]MCE7923692.1 hypothetical protein [Haliscomenobacteraceae bacterium CHB4]